MNMPNANTWVLAIFAAGAVASALLAIRARYLLHSAVGLAGSSAFAALLLYALGAREAAVIELSVGGGLVTVLLAFAINQTGDGQRPPESLVPRPVAWGLALGAVLLLAYLSRPAVPAAAPAAPGASLAEALWHSRAVDVVLQVALLFAGALTVLGLLAEPAPERPARAVHAAASEALPRLPDGHDLDELPEPAPAPVEEPVLEEPVLEGVP